MGDSFPVVPRNVNAATSISLANTTLIQGVGGEQDPVTSYRLGRKREKQSGKDRG